MRDEDGGIDGSEREKKKNKKIKERGRKRRENVEEEEENGGGRKRATETKADTDNIYQSSTNVGFYHNKYRDTSPPDPPRTAPHRLPPPPPVFSPVLHSVPKDGNH